MRVGHESAGETDREKWQRGLFDKGFELSAGVGKPSATPRDHDRALGLVQQIDHTVDVGRIGRRPRNRERPVGQRGVLFGRTGKQVDRDADMCRPRPSGESFLVRTSHMKRYLPRVGGHGGIFGHAAHEGELIHILERVPVPQLRGAHTADG